MMNHIVLCCLCWVIFWSEVLRKHVKRIVLEKVEWNGKVPSKSICLDRPSFKRDVHDQKPRNSVCRGPVLFMLCRPVSLYLAHLPGIPYCIQTDVWCLAIPPPTVRQAGLSPCSLCWLCEGCVFCILFSDPFLRSVTIHYRPLRDAVCPPRVAATCSSARWGWTSVTHHILSSLNFCIIKCVSENLQSNVIQGPLHCDSSEWPGLGHLQNTATYRRVLLQPCISQLDWLCSSKLYSSMCCHCSSSGSLIFDFLYP